MGRLILVLGAVICSAAAASSAGINALVEDLHGAEDSSVRLEAVHTLSMPAYKGSLAFKTLAWAMQNDLSNKVRQAAAIALMNYEGGDTLPLLDKFLEEEIGDDVRRSVCAALATAPAYGSNRTATTLLAERLLEDSSPAVRLAIIEKLLARQDTAALDGLKHASKEDEDERVRAAALAAWKKLSTPPEIAAVKPPKPEPPPYGAVKGVDHCPLNFGWCECSRPPLKIRPRCVSREDCEHVFFNSYKRQGFFCSWNGENIE